MPSLSTLSNRSERSVRSTSPVLSFLVGCAVALSVFPPQAKSQTAEAQQTREVDPSQSIQRRGPEVQNAVHHDASIPLAQMTPALRQSGQRVHAVKPIPRPASGGRVDPSTADLAVQPDITTALAPVTLLNFDGIGNGFSGPAGSFTF